MATLDDLVLSLRTHLELLDDKYKEARDLQDHVLNTLSFDNKNYQEWLSYALEALDDHLTDTNPHEITVEQINSYNKATFDTLLNTKFSNFPIISTYNFVSTLYTIPTGIDSNNQPLSFDGLDWLIKPVHLFLHDKYRFVDENTVIEDAFIITSLLQQELDDYLDPINISLSIVLDEDKIKYQLSLDTEVITPDDVTHVFIANGTLTDTDIQFVDTPWFVIINNTKLLP